VPKLRIDDAGGTTALPEGWRIGIYVGGPRPFFIQHVEVTVRDYRKAVPDYRPAFEGDSLPAHGVSFERAKSYARAAGLRLPTREQWLRAAALSADSPYPWGSDDPAGRCGLGQAKPSRAGRPKGDRSLFGVAGLTGNVREWLRDGTVIGGSFRTPSNTPPERLFRPAKPADGATLDDIGFRCVLELDR
jgi:formylglycine-generating enzyme required for sulfatase activity